jgi:hypothetical protein
MLHGLSKEVIEIGWIKRAILASLLAAGLRNPGSIPVAQRIVLFGAK